MKPQMRLSPGKSLMFLLCAFIMCFIIVNIFAFFITKSGLTVTRLHILTLLQDIFMFIVPALATALISSRYPARLLEVDRAPRLKVIILMILTLFAAIPALNFIVELNESMSLPESMAAIETWMKESEKIAEETTNMLISGTSVTSLILSLMTVGVMAGFSEELLFRGTIQRLVTPANGQAHVAIWTAAFIFSAIHLQFYGFVPRMLLGAFFGYLLVWSGSLWLPIIGHTLNNSIVVLSTWLTNAGYTQHSIDHLGLETTTWDLALGSAVLTAGMIVILRRESLAINKEQSNQNKI